MAVAQGGVLLFSLKGNQEQLAVNVAKYVSFMFEYFDFLLCDSSHILVSFALAIFHVFTCVHCTVAVKLY